MNRFFQYFEYNGIGILLFFLVLIGIMIIINWLLWMLKIGRYKNSIQHYKGSVIFILTEMIVKIITDFRHFLALILVVIFASSLVYAMTISDNNVEKLSDALQAVVSTLGGLIGSIVGYYFGESAARTKNRINATEDTISDNAAVQGESKDEEIKEITQPSEIK